MRIAALFVLAATLMPVHAAEQGALGMQNQRRPGAPLVRLAQYPRYRGHS